MDCLFLTDKQIDSNEMISPGISTTQSRYFFGGKNDKILSKQVTNIFPRRKRSRKKIFPNEVFTQRKI